MITREGIHLGPLYLHFYGLIIIIGALGAAFLAAYEAKRRKISPDYVWDMLPWVLIGGIVGARIWHVLTPTPSMGVAYNYYFTHPLEALMIWKGGLGIPGGVIGGAIAVLIYARKKKQSFLTWGDIIVPGLLLAQAVGRIGNFLNQELYGKPSTLPWAIYIEPDKRLAGYKNFSTFHPLFLYEMVWNIFNMLVLLYIGRRLKGWLRKGDLFLMYCVLYPVTRFTLEFLRIDYASINGININQAVMAVVAVVAVILLFVNHRVQKPEMELAAAGDDDELEETLEAPEPGEKESTEADSSTE